MYRSQNLYQKPVAACRKQGQRYISMDCALFRAFFSNFLLSPIKVLPLLFPRNPTTPLTSSCLNRLFCKTVFRTRVINYGFVRVDLAAAIAHML